MVAAMPMFRLGGNTNQLMSFAPHVTYARTHSRGTQNALTRCHPPVHPSNAAEFCLLVLCVSQVLTMGNERFHIPEVLFHPSNIGLSQMGLSEAVATCIERWVVARGGCASCGELLLSTALYRSCASPSSSLFVLYGARCVFRSPEPTSYVFA